MESEDRYNQTIKELKEIRRQDFFDAILLVAAVIGSIIALFALGLMWAGTIFVFRVDPFGGFAMLLLTVLMTLGASLTAASVFGWYK